MPTGTELMSDGDEDALAERTRAGLERVKPRELASNPRCPDCWDGPMMHPAHRWGPCQIRDIGAPVVCGCTSVRQT
jgi:hypothetical protein